MGTRTIYDDELHGHFVTFSCYRRRRPLDDDRAKRLSSHHIGRLVRGKFVHYAEKIGDADPFWQPKHYALNLHSEEKVREKLRYMHENPVRAGLVARACDWAFSSARYHEQGRSVGVPTRWMA